MALGGALIGGKQAIEQSHSPHTEQPKIESTSTDKSEIRQKIAYLDEYVAAIESGKDKEQAYREFALKMSDGNVKKMEEALKKIEATMVNKNDIVLLMLLGVGLFAYQKLSKAPKKEERPSMDVSTNYKRNDIGFHTR